MSDFDTYLTDFPVCPYCGTQDQDWWDCTSADGLKGDGDKATFNCDECGKDYEVELAVSYSFTTSETEQPPPRPDPIPRPKLPRLTVAEWREEGERLFGPVEIEWRFVCPSCGHVQTPHDFLQYKDQGATPNTAYSSCIGRWDGHGHVDMCSGEAPCNYTSGGLLNINPQEVVHEDGTTMRVFAFAAAGR